MTNNEIVIKIAEILGQRGETVSTAESCTGGRIAAALTSISGASHYFNGGIVAYQNQVKVNELQVNPEDITRYDVVSRQVVEQMVKGACDKFGSTYAIATTGYADQGSDKVAGGNIWVGVGCKDKVQTCLMECDGDREQNVQDAVHQALLLFMTITMHET